MTEPSTTFARDLAARDLKTTISFDWKMPQSSVRARITGAVQMIQHQPASTTVDLTGNGSTTSSFMLHPDAVVTREVA